MRRPPPPRACAASSNAEGVRSFALEKESSFVRMASKQPLVTELGRVASENSPFDRTALGPSSNSGTGSSHGLSTHRVYCSSAARAEAVVTRMRRHSHFVPGANLTGVTRPVGYRVSQGS
jgi:hypothetical protein